MIIVIWCENGKVALRLGGGQSESMTVYGHLDVRGKTSGIYESAMQLLSLSLSLSLSLFLPYRVLFVRRISITRSSQNG